MGKNIRKVQQMLKGEYNYKTQIGYTPDKVDRKIGEIWEDSEGIRWEQKKGYKIKVSKLPGVGIFGNQCSNCDKRITRGVHRDTYNRMGRCYHCQINFEVDLKSKKIGHNGNKWDFWVKLQQLKRWESIDREAEEIVNEMADEINPFDLSVANALANENRKDFKRDAGG